MKLGISAKFLIAMIISQLLVLVALTLVLRWSFGQGLDDFLESSENRLLQPLVNALEKEYQAVGSLSHLHERRRDWTEMLRASLPGVYALPRPFPSPPHRRDRARHRDDQRNTDFAHRPPRPPLHGPPPALQDSNGLIPRLGLVGLNDTTIVGSDQLGDLRRIALHDNDQTIGYLTLTPSLLSSDKLVDEFRSRQNRVMISVALLALGLSALMVLLLTRNMLGPIRHLAYATHRLASGDYRHRVSMNRGDELGDLALDVNNLSKILEQNEISRKQWLADISHELRTPLAILRGEIEALQDGVRQANNKTWNSLHEEALHLGTLVDDLYILALSDAGNLSYRMEAMEIVDFTLEITDSFNGRFKAHDLSMTFQSALPKTTIIEADSGRLTQLFNNLLENSLRYTHPGGTVEVTLEAADCNINLSVADSAPGVSDDDLARLFDRMYRTDASRNRDNGGAGIGLSLCRAITVAHQGSIIARHSFMNGVTIIVTLPIRQQ